jgi:hypothetical protein
MFIFFFLPVVKRDVFSRGLDSERSTFEASGTSSLGQTVGLAVGTSATPRLRGGQRRAVRVHLRPRRHGASRDPGLASLEAERRRAHASSGRRVLAPHLRPSLRAPRSVRRLLPMRPNAVRSRMPVEAGLDAHRDASCLAMGQHLETVRLRLSSRRRSSLGISANQLFHETCGSTPS